jgi:uncharacterized membrane protein YesL
MLLISQTNSNIFVHKNARNLFQVTDNISISSNTDQHYRTSYLERTVRVWALALLSLVLNVTLVLIPANKNTNTCNKTSL